MSLHDYIKLRKIGEGSFGNAWLVQNSKIDRLFVIKQVKMSRMSEKEKNLALTEVSILSKLSHFNIVSYIDSFIENGKLNILMEYCDGGDLYSKIESYKQKEKRFCEKQITEWCFQLTSALNYIHLRNILHRDVKTQNIFLKNGSLKLGDFGIAKILNHTLEFAKTFIGTPISFSPEIVKGDPYNHKSDVWSLGCVIYELTMLKLPFHSDNMNGLFCKILKTNFESIELFYSRQLNDVISLMLKRSPKKRPNTEEIMMMPLFHRKSFKSQEPVGKEIKQKLIKKVDSSNQICDKKSRFEINRWESMENLGLKERSNCKDLIKNHVSRKSVSANKNIEINQKPRSSSYNSIKTCALKIKSFFEKPKIQILSGINQQDGISRGFDFPPKPPTIKLISKKIKKMGNDKFEIFNSTSSKIPQWIPTSTKIF